MNVRNQSRMPSKEAAATRPFNGPALLPPVERRVRELVPGWALLPLRVFLGVTFIYAGIQKFTDPQFFRRSTPGYIGNQIIGFAHGSPLHDILIHQVLPHALLFGAFIAIGELAIGLGTLVGLLLRPAAFFGLLLSMVFYLTASWHVFPYFYGADIVFVFAWLTLLLVGPRYTGYPSLDAALTRALARTPLVASNSLIVTALLWLLGGVAREPLPEAHIDMLPTQKHSASPGSRQQRQNLTRRAQETRRSFLYGTLTGGLGALILGAGALLLRNAVNSASAGSTPPPTSPASNPASPSGSGGGTLINHVSSVPKDSSYDFTLPSTGDPGVLVHLKDDTFVAYDATCTHAGCQVEYDPASHHLICPCHGAEFDPAQGAAVLQGPTNTPLTSVPIHVDSATGAITLK